MLARTLGRSVDELLESISADEYVMWMLEYARNPWGDRRSDVNLANIAATIHNMAGKISTSSENLGWKDYSPFDSVEVDEEDSVDPAEFFGKVIKNART